MRTTPEPGRDTVWVVTTPTTPITRPRRTWDLVLTIVLLVLYLVVTGIASAMSVFLAFASDSCGASSVCDTGLMGTGMVVAMVGVWVPVIVVLVVAIVLLVTRRLAFWVPVVGILLTIGIAFIGFALVFGAVKPA